MNSHIAPILATAFVVSCATTPEQAQPVPTQRTFNTPKSIVWPAVVAEVGLDYPIRSFDQESGLIATDDVSLPVGNWNINKAIRRWVLSPGGNILVGYRGLRVGLNVLVTEPEAGATHVSIRTRYEALQGPLGSSDATWVGARSNGSLEQDLLNRIGSRIEKTR